MTKDAQGKLGLPVMSLALLVVLVALLLAGQDERAVPSVASSDRQSNAPGGAFLPVAQGQTVFSADAVADFTGLMTNGNPFATRFFIPPAPPSDPDPPPPANRKITVAYVGSYALGDGERRGFLRVDGQLVTASKGSELAGGLVVAGIDADQIELTGPSGAVAPVLFRSEAVIEIPR